MVASPTYIKAKLYEVFELRHCEHVKKRKLNTSSAFNSDTQWHRMKTLQVQHTKGKPVTTSGTMITENVCLQYPDTKNTIPGQTSMNILHSAMKNA
jgi:hypothetical protein